MKPSQPSDDEHPRLEALRQYSILDTLPDQALDDLTALVGYVCGTPIALISLIDEDRQWFKSKIGVSVSETPRDGAFSPHVIVQRDLLIVPDAAKDSRFADSPLVTGDSHIRFYAGAPLIAPDGHVLGTLCVMDREPRQLTPPQQQALRVLSRQVMAHLELRRRTDELVASETRLFEVFRNCPVGLAIHRWRDRALVDVNTAFTTLLEWPREQVVGRTAEDLKIVDADAASQLWSRLETDGGLRDTELLVRTRGGEMRHALMGAVLVELRHERHAITSFVDITQRKQAEEALLNSGRLAQSTIDALSAHVCVLDEIGQILTVNEAWRQFAEANPASAHGARVGDNYLHVCDAALAADAPEAAAFAQAIREAVRDERSEFASEYACHAAAEQRWFVGRVTRFLADGSIRIMVAHEDVTERKRAEIAASRLASIVESSDDAVIGKDLDSIVTSWNQGATKVFGYTAAEMVGTSITRLIPADRQDEEAHILSKIVRGERLEHFETLRRTKAGRLINVSVTASPIRDSEGRVIGASKVARDITEQRRAEEAVRRERDRAQRYLDTAEVILLGLDLDARITSINRKGCTLLGWTEAELLGQNWVERCLPERVRREPTSRFENLAGGELTIVEIPIVTKDGQERLVEWRNRHVRDEAGRIAGTFSSGTDITERHEAIEALRATEERMRFALQNAEVGIWDMDYLTGVLRWSETLEAQYGFKPGTFGGTFEAFTERIHPDDRESLLATIGQAARDGNDFSTLHRAIWPDGTVRWLSGAGRVLLGAQGEPLRGVGISQDVTERRSLEQQYQHAQKMEAIGRLAGGVAHDFNNLLTVIVGYCELLLSDFAPGDPRYADVAEIRKAGYRAGGLTRQLLAFSRKQIIEPTILDLNKLTKNLQSMLGRLIGEDIKVSLVLQPDLGLVKADRGQVEQIVMNLAVNARDAMPDGGRLTIETANVELDEYYARTHPPVKPGPYVLLTVTDTGTGMTAEVQSRLFEPFFTTKEAGKGTGLGMATVYGIVTRSGGTVGVYSELGKGTAFKVYFPKTDASDVAVETPAPVVRPGTGTQTVLVVEDEESLRELAKRILQRQGYTVLVAADAAEALRLFAENPSIDLILTDVVMPGASGPELTRQIVEQRPGLKVIYMSGYTEDNIVQHGVLKPGIAFLNKPFTADTLGAKIREVLER